jgi:glutathionylspermidine synthase
MKRISTDPRNNWQTSVEKLGFGFHSSNVPYWDESAYYSFTMEEILDIEDATACLWDLCLQAVQHVIDKNLCGLFQIPENFGDYIKKSWNEDHASIYGRFDLCFNNGKIKLLEFNADTPTSLYEAGIVQWFWLMDFDDQKDQFNSIHEKIIACWKYVHAHLYPGDLHFGCLKNTLEDLTNTEYLRDCAMQAGISTKLVYMDDIGWDEKYSVFRDLQNLPMKNLFKLYPWEWMVGEEFGEKILLDKNRMLFIEPAWKMILSNKALLPLLWELFPQHPLLLPAYFKSDKLSRYVKKPLLSREGANIEMINNNQVICQTDGPYGDGQFIYQELFPLPEFEGNYPVIGSWVIGGEPAGMGIRESNTLITDNLSRFIPHVI